MTDKEYEESEEKKAGLTKEQAEQRIRERGDASDLLGTVTCTQPDGTPVPCIDHETGDELLGIGTGEYYEEVQRIMQEKFGKKGLP